MKKVTRVLSLLLPIPLLLGSYLESISSMNSFSFYSMRLFSLPKDYEVSISWS